MSRRCGTRCRRLSRAEPPGQPRIRHGSMRRDRRGLVPPSSLGRIVMRVIVFVLCLFLVWGASRQARAEDPWMVLPPTPSLPQATESGYAPVNGIKIWYATFGEGEPVILLHGGLGNSNYWGHQ